MLCFCFVLFVFILYLVCPKFPVSLDCQFLIAPSVFSNVYFFFKLYPSLLIFPFLILGTFVLLNTSCGGKIHNIKKALLAVNFHISSVGRGFAFGTEGIGFDPSSRFEPTPQKRLVSETTNVIIARSQDRNEPCAFCTKVNSSTIRA